MEHTCVEVASPSVEVASHTIEMLSSPDPRSNSTATIPITLTARKRRRTEDSDADADDDDVPVHFHHETNPSCSDSVHVTQNQSVSNTISQFHPPPNHIGWTHLQTRLRVLSALQLGHRSRVLAALPNGNANVPGVSALRREIDLLTKPIERTASMDVLTLNEEAAAIKVLQNKRRRPSLSQVFGGGGGKLGISAPAVDTNLVSMQEQAQEEGEQILSPILHTHAGVAGRLGDETQLTQIFIDQMGSALFVAGLPAHVVYFYLLILTKHFHISLRMTSVYNGFLCQWNDEPACRLIQGTPGNMSLDKICAICECTENILRGSISPIEGLAELETILTKPTRYPAWVCILATALFNATYAPLFNGPGWHEVGVAALGGIIVGVFDAIAPGNALLERGHDLLCAVCTSIIAALYHVYISPLNLMAANLSGVCWALPGLRLVMAVIDISTGHVVNGMAQFLGGAITLANLGIGIAAGLQIFKIIPGSADDFFHNQTSSGFDLWTWPLFGFVSVFPCMILFDATWSHLPQLIAGTALAFVCSTWATEWLGTAAGTWLSALVLGIASNIYGRRTRWPSLEVMLFSVLILLPGGVGVQSILAQDSLGTVNFLVQMMVLVFAITTGLFTANFVVRPDAAV